MPGSSSSSFEWGDLHHQNFADGFFEIEQTCVGRPTIESLPWSNTKSLLMSRSPSDEDSLSWERVLKEERRSIDYMRSHRNSDMGRMASGHTDSSHTPFAVAFSGGGIRAAAFQAGVLWRLAEMDRLKDVEYLAAVSGGSYVAAAFASQCLAAEAPKTGHIKQWYLDVVAKTLCRMQENAGDFIRDCVSVPGWLGQGAGVLPRFLDLPVLLLSLGFTLSVNPIMFFTAFVVPFTIVIELFFGPAMRAAFCVEPHHVWDVTTVLSPIRSIIFKVFPFMVVATAVVHFITMLPWFRLGQTHPGQRRLQASTWYLVGHATNALFKRITLGISLLVIFLFVAVSLEHVLYTSPKDRSNLCDAFIKERSEPSHSDCVDDWQGKPWWEDKNVTIIMTKLKLTADSQGSVRRETSRADGKENVFGFFSYFFLACSAMLVCSLCVIPFVGGVIFTSVLSLAGPVFLIIIMTLFVQYGVFSPMTKNKAGLTKYNDSAWRHCRQISLITALLLIPVFNEIRSALHTYYKRSLQKNFFHDGRDHSLPDLKDCHYCPLMIFTVTSSDYQPPGKSRCISELSISPLHTGSGETDYVRTPSHRSLAKSTALSGAGCLDAMSLSMSEAWTMRFWLEVLNLSWGDYILFERRRAPIIEKLVKMVGPYWEATAVRFIGGAPVVGVWMIAFVMLNITHVFMESHAEHHCRSARYTSGCAFFIVFILLSLSFYSFFYVFDLLALSAISRQFLQAVSYYFVGRRPPRMLYVTDGGVRDCTATVQLMRRRCKRILLVLAAADPNDELGVLKAALACAEEERICCFYDPADPRRSILQALETFKDDKSQSFLHLGIYYSASRSDEQSSENVGHLFVVKNRLPPGFEGQPIQQPITEQEVTGRGIPSPPPDFIPEEWHGLTTDELGSLGCCDCCHVRGWNYGPKFPHGTFTGYLYLTPQWFNSLARLGYDLSEQVIREVTREGSLAHDWESSVFGEKVAGGPSAGEQGRVRGSRVTV